MSWARIDDKFYAHPKTYRLGKLRLPAIGLHVLAITWSCDQLTDGVLPEDAVTMLGGTRPLIEALIAAGMWHHSEERREYLIHDFDAYNKTRDQVLRDREKWRDRQDKSRGVSRRDSDRDTASDSLRNLNRISSESRSPVPVPVPVSRDSKKERERDAKSKGGPTPIGDVIGDRA